MTKEKPVENKLERFCMKIQMPSNLKALASLAYKMEFTSRPTIITTLKLQNPVLLLQNKNIGAFHYKVLFR